MTNICVKIKKKTCKKSLSKYEKFQKSKNTINLKKYLNHRKFQKLIKGLYFNNLLKLFVNLFVCVLITFKWINKFYCNLSQIWYQYRRTLYSDRI